MTSISHPGAQRRARWLAQLDEALDAASRLSREIDPSDSIELAALRERIELARAEVERMRRGAPSGMTTNNPEWINLPSQRRDLSETAVA